MGSGCRRAGAQFLGARHEASTQRANLRSDFDVSSGWCTPRMVTRLARLVHNRQSAPAGEDKRHSECYHQRCLHGETRLLLAPEPASPQVNRDVDERAMNTDRPAGGPRASVLLPGWHGRGGLNGVFQNDTLL